jgi:hypothetical protein
MKCNVGWVEQIVRLLIGLPIAGAYFYLRHFSLLGSVVALAIGISLMITAIFRRCPVHHILGTSTMRRSPEMAPGNRLGV